MSIEMYLIYLGAALVGGLLLIVQTLLTVFGGDVDFEADLGDGAGAISFRTVIAFITFFGVGGLAARAAGLNPLATLLFALGCGFAAFWLLGLAMLQMSRLQSSGNVDIRNAVGREAKVYLKIPAAHGGTGRVTVSVQGRSVQFRAVTAGPELPTGVLCKVVATRAENTVEVEAV